MSEHTVPLIPATTTPKAGSLTFALLFSLESFARSLNSGVLSIQAYDILGSSQKVSVLGTAVSLVVLIVTLFLPWAFGHLRRRWAYTLGCLLMIAGSFGLATFSLPGQIAGTMMRNCGASVLSVTLQLYILDHIKKADLTKSEPLRLALSTASWAAGPITGVWLYQHWGVVAPQVAAVAACALLLGVFWYLRLNDARTLPTGTLQPFNPMANASRFLKQPRLRLAWAIAFARSCFWGALFTYGPLLLIEGGQGKQAGGLILSVSQLFLLSAFVFGPFARVSGVRKVLTLCFAAIAVCATLAGIAGTSAPILAAALLLVAALFASGIDSVGGIPYLRAVKPHERQQMTAVYRTYIEFSELLPSIVFAIVLRSFDVSIVFAIIGLSLSAMAILVWRYVPKSM